MPYRCGKTGYRYCDKEGAAHTSPIWPALVHGQRAVKLISPVRPTARATPWPLGSRRAQFHGAATEPDLLGEPRTSRGIGRCRYRVIRRQTPAGPILGDLEPVRNPQMLAQHLCAKPAFEANHKTRLDRAADRHRRRRQLLHRWGTPETGKRDALRQSVLEAGRPQSGDAAHSCSPRSDRDRPAMASLVLALVSSLIMILAVVEVLAVRFNHVQFA